MRPHLFVSKQYLHTSRFYTVLSEMNNGETNMKSAVRMTDDRYRSPLFKLKIHRSEQNNGGDPNKPLKTINKLLM